MLTPHIIALMRSWRLGILLLTFFILNACGQDTIRTERVRIWYESISDVTHGNVSSPVNQISSIDPTRLESTPLLKGDPNHLYDIVSFSPERRRIAYTLTNGKSSISVWLANADGSNPQKISSDYAYAGFIWLNENRILTLGTNNSPPLDPDKSWEHSLYDIPTQAQRILILEHSLDYCVAPNMSVRSNRMAIRKDGMLSLGHLELLGDSLLAVADLPINRSSLPDPLAANCLSWNMDAQKIVVQQAGLGNQDLFITTDGGRTLQPLTRFGSDYEGSFIDQFSISPDGNWIVFSTALSRPRSSNLITGSGLIALASTDGKTLDFVGQNLRPRGGFVWSPDSRYAAVGLWQTNGAREDQIAQIYLIDAVTKQVRKLTSDNSAKEVFDWH